MWDETINFKRANFIIDIWRNQAVVDHTLSVPLIAGILAQYITQLTTIAYTQWDTPTERYQLLPVLVSHSVLVASGEGGYGVSHVVVGNEGDI